MNRVERRKALRKRCKYFTQPYKNGRTRERARLYYWPPKDKEEKKETING